MRSGVINPQVCNPAVPQTRVTLAELVTLAGLQRDKSGTLLHQVVLEMKWDHHTRNILGPGLAPNPLSETGFISRCINISILQVYVSQFALKYDNV